MPNKDLVKLLRDSGQAQDLSKLIRKLRWIGLEEEARQLQLSLVSLGPDHRIPVPSEPLNTD